jgi:hypothetical protein
MGTQFPSPPNNSPLSQSAAPCANTGCAASTIGTTTLSQEAML